MFKIIDWPFIGASTTYAERHWRLKGPHSSSARTFCDFHLTFQTLCTCAFGSPSKNMHKSQINLTIIKCTSKSKNVGESWCMHDVCLFTFYHLFLSLAAKGVSGNLRNVCCMCVRRPAHGSNIHSFLEECDMQSQSRDWNGPMGVYFHWMRHRHKAT